MSANPNLPITAICVVSDQTKRPSNYTAIAKSFDTNTEADLWKDGMFSKKINRFICFTKDYPIADTYNVIEDIKILNDRDNVIGGFVPVDRCLDNNEKAFQKKVLCIKVSHRYFTQVAVSDIIILMKSKRAPVGYSYIGEINNQSICIKFSPIPNNSSTSNSPNNQVQSIPPPIPPRPTFVPQVPDDSIEQSYVHVNVDSFATTNGANADIHMNRLYVSQNSHSIYNPLQGVPFEINPIYQGLSSKQEELIDLEKIQRKLNYFNDIFERYDYDFKLEHSCLTHA